MERETTSEVGDTQCDGEWWLGSNSKEDGSFPFIDCFISECCLYVIYLFLKPMWFYNILFIFETYVIVTLYNFVVILDYFSTPSVFVTMNL